MERGDGGMNRSREVDGLNSSGPDCSSTNTDYFITRF